jgi:hypothetical protein
VVRSPLQSERIDPHGMMPDRPALAGISDGAGIDGYRQAIPVNRWTGPVEGG